MIRPTLVIALMFAVSWPAPGTTDPLPRPAERLRAERLLRDGLQLVPVASRRTCKSVSTCEEAVALWCGGYRRADGDNDGIPCETVCRSKPQVDAIRARIGC